MKYILFFLFCVAGQQYSSAQEWGYIPANENNNPKYEYCVTTLIKSYEQKNYMNIFNVLSFLGEEDAVAYSYIQKGFIDEPKKLCRFVLNFKNLLEKGAMSQEMSIVSNNPERWDTLCADCEKIASNFIESKKPLLIDSTNINKHLLPIFEGIKSNDQKYRGELTELLKSNKQKTTGYTELWKKQDEIDRLNLVLVEAIIKEYGYPGLSLVGPKLKGVALMILHHQPNIETREKYLPILEQAVKAGELNSIAFFIDRTAMLKADAKKEGN